MKKNSIILLFLILFNISAQDLNVSYDLSKWQAPYYLPTPKNWSTERFFIPISFAKNISYKGVEDIRFTIGVAQLERSKKMRQTKIAHALLNLFKAFRINYFPNAHSVLFYLSHSN